jgi:hypothetical protein
VVIQTEPVSERPRANVAERVRAVAASSRPGQADTPVRDGSSADADDASLTEVALAEAGLDEGGLDEGALETDLGDLEGEESASFAGSAEAADEEAPSARRRARRGSSRRRTRP